MRRSIISLTLIFAAFAAMGQSMVLDKIIAKVGNEYVLLSEVEERFALATEKQAVPEGGKCTIMEELMVTNLLVHHARIDSVEVGEDVVEAQLDDRIDQILGMMGNDVAQFEDYYGMTIAQAKDLNRQDLRKKLNAEEMRRTILANTKVTPSEVIDYFNAIPEDSLPYFNSEVEIAEIVYKPKVNPAERQKALQEVNELRDRVLGGDDFAQIAILYSDDLGSGKQGGALGKTSRGQFVQEYEAAAYRLDIGEISEVVESEFGFHVIKLDGRWGDVIETRHILIRPEITDADLDTAKMILEEMRQHVLGDSITFAQAVKEFSDENTQSYSNSGRVTNPQTGNTFFETAELDHQVFFAIDTLKPGDLTSPIEYRMPTGDVIYKVIELQSRTPPHRASLRQDYSKIQAAAKNNKQNDAVFDWIKQKVSDTYIIIDKSYQTCPNLEKWKAKTISKS